MIDVTIIAMAKLHRNIYVETQRKAYILLI